MKKIGIDARFFGEAGPGRYTKSIVEHLEKVDDENKYIIFLNENGYKLYTPKNKNFEKVLADYSWYSFEEQIGFLFTILKQKLDLYYVPHFNIPILYPGKIVTAIPDMTMHTYSTEKGTTLPLWYFKFKMIVYKLVFWWAVFRSYKVIVPTQTVKDEFLKHLNFKEDKYVLAYEGVDPDYLKPPQNPEQTLKKYGIDTNFILSLGSMYEHKNVDGLIDAYKLLKEKYAYKGKLVLASKRDKFSLRVFEEMKNQGLENDVLVLAYKVDSPDKFVVSDQEAINLRSKADLYVQLAFKEGFSLTAMEAAAQELPSVLSDIDCHREVYQDSVLFADPYDIKDIASKINELLTNKDLYSKYVSKGKALLKKYSWENCARITLNVFKDALRH